MKRLLDIFHRRNFHVSLIIFLVFFNIIVLVVTWPYVRTHILRWEEEGNRRVESAKNVEVEKVVRRSMESRVVVNGIIRARDSVDIVSEISGRVKSIHFQQGDIVKKGHLLIQLDDSQAKAELLEAQAHEKQTQSVYWRRERLFNEKHIQTGRGYGSKADMEEAKAKWDMAKAAVQRATAHVDQTRIVASQDGKIGLHDITVGTSVNPHQLITRVVRSDVFTVEMSVSESDASFIHPKQEVYVSIEEDAAPVLAVVDAVEPYSDPISHMTRVRALINNTTSKLKEGLFVRVIIPLAKVEDALVVPHVAVVSEGEQDCVFVFMKGKAIMRPVTLGIKEGNFVQILEGVEEGELVIVDSPEHMVNNLPVNIVKGEQT